jgi:hypothetical protein
MQRRRTTRRIQALERVARRAMNDYRIAIQGELSASLSEAISEAASRRVH